LLPELQTALDALQAADGSSNDMVEADLAFHRLLCAASGNTTLVRAWETLTGPIRVAILFAGPATALTNMSTSRHQELLDAIGSGDPVTARTRSTHTCARPPTRGRTPGSGETVSTLVNSQQVALNRLCWG